MKTEVERFMRGENWAAARASIEKRLQERPDDHVLLTRLAAVFHEMRDYQRALRCSERARQLSPNCPLVLWDSAGTLQMLGKHEDALKIYRTLAKRKPGLMAKEPCISNRAQARGLVADCHYRMMRSLDALGRGNEATNEFEAHLDLRGPGCYSIYPLGTQRKKDDVIRNWRPCAA